MKAVGQFFGNNIYNTVQGIYEVNMSEADMAGSLTRIEFLIREGKTFVGWIDTSPRDIQLSKFYDVYKPNDWSTNYGKISFTSFIGGDKSSSQKKPTKERVIHQGKPRIVYVGSRGAKYIKKSGKYISLKNLQK